MSNDPFDKDKFAALMQLTQLGVDQWDKRRVYEWRVTFALWAVIAGSLAVKDIQIPIYAGPILLIGYVGLWLRRTWLANERNKAFARFYLSKAQAMVGDEVAAPPGIPAPKSTSWWSFLGDTGMLFPAVATAILIGLVYSIKGW